MKENGTPRVYGEPQPGPDSARRVLRIKQWFTEPAVERRKLRLDGGSSSWICQHALYGRKVFRADEDQLFGQQLDFFEDQRKSTDDA